MRVSKNKVTLLSLAVAGLFAATASHAIVNLNTGATPALYASEITASVFTPFNIPATAATTAQVTLGFGLSSAQQKYIRFDLTNAVFGAVVTPNMLSDFTTPLNLPVANIIVALGGTVGSSTVIFQITATNTGIPFTDVMQFATPLVRVTSTATAVKLQYALHDTAASAGSTGSLPPNSALLIANIQPLVNFQTGNLWSFGAVQPEVVAATQIFTKFCAGTAGAPGTAGCSAAATDFDAFIGQIANYTFDPTVLDATGALLASNATINTATSKTVITGDFSAASGAYVSTNNVCLGSVFAAGTVTATTATFTTGNTTLATPLAICFTANGTAAIAAQTFTGKFVPTAAAGYTSGTYASVPTGQFVRDGIELQAPWFTLGGPGSAYISRFFLTNTGSAPVTCTVTTLSEAGNVLTAGPAVINGVTIPGNGQVAVLGTDVVVAASVANRGAVRFACPAPSANIQGRYVLTHSSGAVDSGTLLRPGTN